MPIGLPLCYHANDVFMSIHTASYDAVAAALPSEALQPGRWYDGRALIAVSAFRYRAVTWARSDGSTGAMIPYGEVSVAAVVTVGPAPRVLPLLARRLSGFVLHLPVTTMQARDGGLELWGFPKFVADMDFLEAPDERRVRLSEGGADILTLTVRPGGPVLPERRPLIAYTSLRGQLVETAVPVLGHGQTRLGSRAGEVVLGEHPVAGTLRELRIAPTSVAATSWLDHRSVLPAGTAIRPARAYEGYRGVDRPTGRFTVAYPGAPAFDQYADGPASASARGGPAPAG